MLFVGLVALFVKGVTLFQPNNSVMGTETAACTPTEYYCQNLGYKFCGSNNSVDYNLLLTCVQVTDSCGKTIRTWESVQCPHGCNWNGTTAVCNGSGDSNTAPTPNPSPTNVPAQLLESTPIPTIKKIPTQIPVSTPKPTIKRTPISTKTPTPPVRNIEESKQVLCHQLVGSECTEMVKNSCNPELGLLSGGCPSQTITPASTQLTTQEPKRCRLYWGWPLYRCLF
jgi:hypothetical protein